MMASDLSSGCTEAIDILDEKEEGEISLEDVSSSEEGGMGHLTCSYVISRTRQCPDCKSWGECASWCMAMYHPKSQSRRDPVKGKENRLHVREVGSTTIKNTISTLQEKNDDLVPISSDSDMEIVGLTDTSNRSKTRMKKKKRKKDYETLTIDDLISPSSGELPISEFDTVKTHHKEVNLVHKSSRSRMISKSPIRRYKSPVRTRSPRSPVQKRSSVQKRSPIQRRSPRRLRSPKRNSPKRNSPHRSPVRIARRPSRQDSPSFARSHINRHNDVTRLLKRVKHLDSMGVQALESSVNRNKEHQSSSLKEKLSNMLKRQPDSNDMTHFKEKSNVQSNIVNHDADDEEDLVLLRQKALETKQKKSNKSSNHPADSEKKSTFMRNDDQDEEALQLRMIALRSAVMKKHQNRVQRGIRTNRKPTRSESPFSQCFLDDVPAPSDELLKFASPPCTPPQDSNHIEDMELDTDIEREKEKLPYSPTDVPIDTALLGIEPSDVSFINVNETNSMVFNDITQNDKIDVVPYYDNFPHACESQVNFVYSPSQHGSETFRSELNTGLTELSNHLRDSHSNNVMCDLIDGICCQGETYSTSVALMHISDASCALPVTRNLLVSSIPPENIVTSPQMQQIIEQPIGGILFANVDPTFRDDRCAYEMQAVSRYSITDSPITFAESVSPNESMITIDDLPEMETDPLSSPIADKNLSATDHIPKEMVPCQAIEGGTSREPLYMQGVPEVTKDVNKIPTLINRTLVPVPILKSNKQLQQPLPTTRKREKHLEPTFKSAEMQPVVAIAEASAKSGSNFKPMKLRVTKKSMPILTSPVAFDNSMKESLENDASEDQRSTASSKSSHEGTELRHCTIASTTHTAAINTDTNAALTRKKRKANVKKNRCKNLNTIQLIAEKQSNSCTEGDINKDVNIITTSTLGRKIAESDQSKCNDDSKVQENSIENRESSSLLNITVNQESILVNSNNIVVENKSVENDQSVSSKTGEELKQTMLLMSAECPQEKSIESHYLLTNSAPNNSDSSTTNNVIEMTKDVNRRQSVDEDENELRAILLASLKRTKPTDTNITSTVPITVNCTTTNTETPIYKKALINIPAVTNTTYAVSNSAPLVSILSSSETVEKKINGTSTSMLRKRSSSMSAVKGLSKKVARKAPIPASTKVVNNAKKYQNMIVQRKLNLRKLDNARNNAKSNENVWSNIKVPKTSLLSSDTQRFVINLGSDTDSESESEKRKAITVTEKHRAQDVSVDFEESVQKFLRDMRKEQESAAAAKPIMPPQATKRDTPPTTQADLNKDSSNMHTPLAVRHLPVSQQEEYRRLKQEILEREKLKLQRKVADSSNNNNRSSSNNKSLSTNVADLPVKSLPVCEKKNTHVKQNQVKLKESEKDFQESLTPILDLSRISANKSFSTNIAKHTNSTHLQTKGIKKTIPNNLSIRITNEIAPSRTSAGNRTIENSDEQQSVSDKQQHRPALRALTKDEINRKYVKVQLKLDSIKRVVTLNDKLTLRHDLTASASQSEKLVENDNVNMEILDEKDRNNENSNSSAFCNTSTAVLSDLSTSLNMKRKELEDTLENISHSQYEAERQREINISSPPPENNNSNNASRQFDINADDKDNTNDVWEVLKRDVKAELDDLINFSETEQQQYLRDTEHKLVARRYNVLDHLAEMSGSLRQWDMEKDLQNSLAIEVRKLKEQLKIAEERLQEQRDRVGSMGPKVSTARQNINAGRRECFKLSKICSTLGNRLMGKNYKLPEAGGQLLIDKFKEVANHTRQFTKKKRIQSNDISENSNSNLLIRTLPLTESFKVTHTEDDITLQEQPENDTDMADVTTSKSDTACLKQSDDDESLSMTEFSLNSSQTFPNQVTLVRKEETLINASKSHSDEQAAPSNQDNLLFCVSNLSNIPIEQNSECTQENNSMDISGPTTPLELKLSVIHPSCQDEQNNKRTLLCQNDQSNTSLSPTPSPPSTPPPPPSTPPPPPSTPPPPPSTPPPPSQTTTITTTMTKMTMIAPYVSILSHLKIPRNMNPHGVLCPYEIMGVCRDEDCQYIHQSRNQT